jgi:hypothetical protein
VTTSKAAFRSGQLTRLGVPCSQRPDGQWFIGDTMDELGTRKEVEYAYRILQTGSSTDRQLATFMRTGNLNDGADQLIAETSEGVVE